ncbi:hypothetical protein M404DRAFT_30495 [Pisolithus tinctorius Marx 270]|uniref:Uncharacterized protein n=1 Tax=Pisolithus tinctorius Marx 270 TaxID=870435 RepID=A0A0C3NW90_PISTI|nr:hypothetical protein M404DRAFT_30495 [Pisolithus tinctorius Marx 270]
MLLGSGLLFILSHRDEINFKLKAKRGRAKSSFQSEETSAIHLDTEPSPELLCALTPLPISYNLTPFSDPSERQDTESSPKLLCALTPLPISCNLRPFSDPKERQGFRPRQVGGTRLEQFHASSHPNRQFRVNSSSCSGPDSIDQINHSLKAIIGNSCHSFMDNLCQNYIDSGDYSRIWAVLSKVDGLESRVRRLK